MGYHIYIGNKSLSSWSLRVWLLFKHFGIPFEETVISLHSPAGVQRKLESIHPRLKTVPVLQDDDCTIADSLAIVEYLAEQFPGLWPEDRIARAEARYITAEMHSGFTNLRAMCPFRCTEENLPMPHSIALERELKLMDEHLLYCITHFSNGSPYLFGEYCIADAYYTPAASRWKSYNLPFSDMVQEYFTQLLQQTGYQEWVEAARAEHVDPSPVFPPGKQE